MKRKFYFVVFFLSTIVSAHADPINIATFPPPPDILAALLIEVLVVAAILWRFRLRLARFIIVWLGINLLSYYILLIGIIVALDSLRYSHDYTILAECVVVAAETAALLWVSRLSFLRSADSKPVSFWWALAASVLGNLTSILSFIGFVALESAMR